MDSVFPDVGVIATQPLGGGWGAGVRTVQWTVANVETSEQIIDASWSVDRRGKRSGFYIANCGKHPRKYPVEL